MVEVHFYDPYQFTMMNHDETWSNVFLYWGKDNHAVHIVHAQSKNVLGPYIEPDKKTWMDNRIDPKVFKDDDGQLYMYMVRFTDGNTIWGRKMKNPAEFAGEPVCLFASLPAPLPLLQPLSIVTT
jgi:hypothetical protein